MNSLKLSIIAMLSASTIVSCAFANAGGNEDNIISGSHFASLLKSPSDCQYTGTGPTHGACPSGAYFVDNKKDGRVLSNDEAGKILWELGTQIGGSQDGATSGETSHWSHKRYAMLIRPGSYTMKAPKKDEPSVLTETAFKLNYYTQVMGVGASKDNTIITPGINALNECDSSNIANDKDAAKKCYRIGALNNFWRSMNNMTFNVPTTYDNQILRIAISQAAPIRNIQVIGNLSLCDWMTGYSPTGGGDWACGMASGGFLSNSVVNGNIIGGSQQQFYFFDDKAQSFQSSLWNYFLQNSQGLDGNQPTIIGSQAADVSYANPWNTSSNRHVAPFTIDNQSQLPQVTQDAPRIVLTGNNPQSSDSWKVKVNNQMLPISDFEIVTLGEAEQEASVATLNADAIDSLNNALSAGKKGVIFMPGMYKLLKTIKVPADKTVLGLGVPSLICEDSNGCMSTESKGIKISGVTFEAGTQSGSATQESNTLLTLGSKGQGDASNPDIIQDVFCRIARTFENEASPSAYNCITVNANYAIGQNLWLWRADHDFYTWDNKNTVDEPDQHLVAWDKDVAEHGLIVNGDDVKMYGLFVEHFNNYQTIWNGKNGQINFYQSEIPYIMPKDDGDGNSLIDCNAPGVESKQFEACPSILITKNATGFKGTGLGIYSYFPDEYGTGFDNPGQKFTQNPIRAKAAIEYHNEDVTLQNVVIRFLNGQAESGIDYISMNDNGYFPAEDSGYSGITKDAPGLGAGNALVGANDTPEKNVDITIKNNIPNAQIALVGCRDNFNTCSDPVKFSPASDIKLGVAATGTFNTKDLDGYDSVMVLKAEGPWPRMCELSPQAWSQLKASNQPVIKAIFSGNDGQDPCE